MAKILFQNQLDAKAYLDKLVKTNLLPEAHLVTYKNGLKEITSFCWLFNDKHVQVFLHLFEDECNLERDFDIINIKKIEAPYYFICNKGAFSLKHSEKGSFISPIDAIYSSEIAKKFLRSMRIFDHELILVKKTIGNNIVNIVWLDRVSNTEIPV